MNKNYNSLNFKWLWTSLAMMLMGTFALNAQCTVDCSQVNQNLNGVVYLGTFDGSAYYKRTAGDLTYHQAKALAESLGGTLPIITSQAENDYITSVAGGNVWLGLSDEAEEAWFEWADGTALTYSNWSAGEPNNSNNEDFVELRSNGTWNDLRENHIRWVIVEIACPCIPSCDNVTDGGTINMGNNPSVNCGSYNPSTLGSTELPSGGSGNMEYIWLSSTSECPTSLSQEISGATSSTYNPGMISQTTYYVRCSRRAGCTSWNLGESNCVTLTVAPDYNVVCEARINGGSYNSLADCTVTVDAGDDLDLSVNPNGATSYAWVGPNGFTATGSTGGDIHIPNITANGAGNYTVTIDVDGCVKTQTITVIVNSVTNNLPTAVNDSSTTNENTSVTIPVTNNDNFGADGPNNGSIVITNNPNNGTATVNNNGTPNDPTDDSIVYTPNAGFTGNDILTYIITDSNGDQSTATVNITVNSNGGGNGPDCNNISITTGNGTITVTGLDGAPVSSLQVFTATWQPVFSCFADCGATETVSVPAGDYLVFAKYYEANYALVCQIDGTFTVTGGGGGNGPCENAGGDSDGDNVCDNDDCAPNNPNLPAVAGTSCDDGNANTINDVVTADGCGCAGTPDGGGNGPDCNDISITTGDGTITVTGLDGAPVSSVQVFTATWQPVFSCFADCSATENISVPAGDYLVFVKYYESNYALVCQEDGTFTVTSGGGGGGNNLPSAQDDAVTTDENTGVNISVTGNDSFGQDGPSTGSISIVTIPGNGTATVNNNGTPNNPTDDTIDYTPNTGFTGTDSFTYVITDSDGDQSTATVTVTVNADTGGNPDCANISITTTDGAITVTGLNGAPVSSVQVFTSTWQPVFSCFADCGATETINVTEGDYLVFVKYYDAGYGLICQVDGTYTVGTGNPGQCPLTTNVNVSNVTCSNNGTPNNPNDDTYTFDVTVTAQAPAGVELWGWSYNSMNGPMYDYGVAVNLGPFPISGGSISFDVLDSDNASCAENVTVNAPAPCSNGNDVPVANDDSATTNMNTSVDVAVNGNDSFGNDGPSNGAIAITVGPNNGTAFVNNNGTPNNPTDDFITYTPANGFFGTDQLTYVITDSNGDTDTAVVTITVNAGAADCANITITTDNNSITVTGLDGAPVSSVQVFTATWSPVYTCFADCDNTVDVVVPSQGDYLVFVKYYESNYTLICQVDGTYTVGGGNNLPTAVNDSATTDSGVAVNVPVTNNDNFGGDGPNNGQIVIVSNPSNGTATVNNNGTPNNPTDDYITYTPNNGFSGQDQLTYQITDSNGDSTTAVATITVNPANNTPTAVNDAATTNAGVAVNVPVTGNDTFGPDGPNNGQILLTTNPSNGIAFVNNNGTPNNPTDDFITYSPNNGFVGTDVLTYAITDSNGDTSSATVTITVAQPNGTPTANNDTATTNTGISVNVPVTGNDTFGPDGPNNGQIIITNGPSNGTAFVNNNGTPNNPTDDFITYSPNNGFVGTDVLTYAITDSNGDTSSATVTITVAQPNGTPTANNDTAATNTGISVNVPVTGNDTFGPDGPNNGQIIITNGPSNGIAFVNNNGTPNNPTDDFITYTPNNGFVGTDVLTYAITDSNGDTSSATVTISVAGPVCDNVTNGGTINMGNNPATNCGPYNPTILGSTTAASGGSGALEYIWLSSTTGCPTSLNQTIAGATNATYDPGTITQTTYYRRCARRAGCTSYNFGESNCITLAVDSGCVDCNNVTHGGSINIGNNPATNCGSYNPTTLGSTTSPSGGSGALEYIWLSSTTGCPTDVSQEILGATSATYNPGTITQTTYYVRCSRRVGCTSWGNGESNCITLTVFDPNTPNCNGGSACTDANILLVVGNTALNNGDTAIRNRLISKGFYVTTIDDDYVQASDAIGKDLVFISSTVISSTLGEMFTDIAIPVLNTDPYLYDEMNYVLNGNYGYSLTSQMTVFNTGHPLVEGVSGTVNIFSSTQSVPWGTPTSNSNDFGYIPGNTNKCLILGWDTGEQMIGMLAPARRVGFFLNNTGASYLTTAGWRLFDNAVYWLIGCPTHGGAQGLVAADDDVLNFTAKRTANEVELNWANNTGFKNDYFVVEHSLDGVNFEAITEKSSANTSEDLTFYNVVDNAPSIGVNYYRVQLIFNDGTSRYTDIKEVQVNLVAEFELYPNPASQVVNINLVELVGENVEIRTIDQLGRTISVDLTQATATPYQLNVSELRNGMYMIMVVSKGKRSVAKQLVIMND